MTDRIMSDCCWYLHQITSQCCNIPLSNATHTHIKHKSLVKIEIFSVSTEHWKTISVRDKEAKKQFSGIY